MDFEEAASTVGRFATKLGYSDLFLELMDRQLSPDSRWAMIFTYGILEDARRTVTVTVGDDATGCVVELRTDGVDRRPT